MLLNALQGHCLSCQLSANNRLRCEDPSVLGLQRQHDHPNPLMAKSYDAFSHGAWCEQVDTLHSIQAATLLSCCQACSTASGLQITLS